MTKCLKQGFRCFSRNERWGCCGYCPVVENDVFPELCSYTKRYDHNMTFADLSALYLRVTKPSGSQGEKHAEV